MLQLRRSLKSVIDCLFTALHENRRQKLCYIRLGHKFCAFCVLIEQQKHAELMSQPDARPAMIFLYSVKSSS